MTDYIIVGCGLAGIAFCEELEKQGKSFVVFDDGSQLSSHVAGGMYNPVILKRFTPVWMAAEQLQEAKPFYNEISEKLGVDFDVPMKVMRRFASVEEQNRWFEVMDKPGLTPFMNPKVHHLHVDGVDDDNGYGEVLHTGWIKTGVLQQHYLEHLESEGKLNRSSFDADQVKVSSSGVDYLGHTARHVVYCEGYGLQQNPFFNYLPLNGTKGELLEVEIPGLDIDFILKSSVFLLPLGGNRYKVGATYKWKDKTQEPTEACKEELTERLERFLKLPYTITNHLAGIRPTVADRRPLVGTHPEMERFHILNGMGSRGVMIGPWAAKRLYRHIEEAQPLDPVMDITRFRKRWDKRG